MKRKDYAWLIEAQQDGEWTAVALRFSQHDARMSARHWKDRKSHV